MKIMKEYLAKKPPCSYCDEDIPHGGGVIDSKLVFRDLGLGIEILMPYCNYLKGRTAKEIVDSIRAVNPEIDSFTIPVDFWERIINYLDMVSPS